MQGRADASRAPATTTDEETMTMAAHATCCLRRAQHAVLATGSPGLAR